MTKNKLKYYSFLKMKKHRDEEKKFLIEGIHLVQECTKSELYKNKILKIILDSDKKKQLKEQKIFDMIDNYDYEFVNSVDFKKLSDTVNSQGIIAVIEKVESNNLYSDLNKSKMLIAGLENINDPGNLGSIIRTCHWFNVDLLIISSDSADIYNSKVLRASQGSVFHINIINELNLFEYSDKLAEKGYSLYVSTPYCNDSINELCIGNDKNVIIFGNESTGVSNQFLESKKFIKIKIDGYSNCESLNVSISAGIIINKFRVSTIN